MPAPILHRDLWPTLGHLVHTVATRGGCNEKNNYPSSIVQSMQCHLTTRDDIKIWPGRQARNVDATILSFMGY